MPTIRVTEVVRLPNMEKIRLRIKKENARNVPYSHLRGFEPEYIP
jgi:hypothetical protein